MEQRRFNQTSAYRFKRFVRKSYNAFNSMHKVVNIGVVAGCTLTMAYTANSVAQTSSIQQPLKIMESELEEVMVSASRIEAPINQTAKLVTIITKEQLSQAPVQSIADLLNYTANIDLQQRSPHGVQADISIRGGSVNQTTILLNGINISNPHTGYYSLDIPINLSDIERIEILHGPAALAYGSGAFAGGVNIITKKEASEKIFATIQGGMHNQKGVEIRSTAKTGIANHSLSASYSSSDGYIANSDYDIYNLLWQSRLQLKENSKIDFQLGYNDKKYGANTFYTADYPEQYEQTSTYIGTVKGEFGTKLKIVPILYWNRHHDQFDLVRNTSFGRNFHRNDTYGANLILSYYSKWGNTSLGGEIRREDIISSKLGHDRVNNHRKYSQYDDRTISSLAFEHNININKVTLAGGILYNYTTLDKKGKFYPSLSISYRPIESLKIHSSWDKSTRLPTFTELYYTTITHESNDKLKSEKSESVELGLSYTKGNFKAYTTGFMMWGRNIIDWVKIDINGEKKTASWNHTRIDTKGIEAGIQYRLGSILPFLGEEASIKIDYTRMHQTFDTQQFSSKFALCYLRDKFTTQLNHHIIKNLSLNWYFRVQKRMGEFTLNEGKPDEHKKAFPTYSRLDLKLNYKWDKTNLFINCENIYDTQYFDLANIPQAGFWLSGGINITL